MGAHPFRIQTTANGSSGTQYNNGVTNNDVSNGTLIFDVPMEHLMFFIINVLHMVIWEVLYLFLMYLVVVEVGQLILHHLIHILNKINITNIHSTTAIIISKSW